MVWSHFSEYVNFVRSFYDVLMDIGFFLWFIVPHRSVYQQLKSVPKGVLCAVVYDGSPAQLYGLHPLSFVTEVRVFFLNSLLFIFE
jgi:hypothetical protein